MGFMGFGMRKEVYKRKPKESFKRIKEIYGNDWTKINHNPNAPKLTSEEILNKPRFKSIHDTKIYKYGKISIIILLLGAFLNFSIVQPWLFERRLSNYKQSLIESYSNEYDFLLNSGNKLQKLSYFNIDSTSRMYMVLTKNIDFENFFNFNDKQVARIGTWNSNASSVKFDEGLIFIDRYDSIQTINDKWIVIYKSDTTDLTYFEILKFTGVESQYIEDIRSKLRSTKISSVTHEDSRTTIELSTSEEFGNFAFVKTNKKLLVNENLIKIDSLTYLKNNKY